MKPIAPGPQSFHGAPGLREGGSRSFYEVVQQAPVVPPLPEVRPTTPPAPAPATLTLRYDERGPICELSKGLRARLPNLKDCSRLGLVVPQRRGGEWYLDTQPRPGAGYQLPNTDRAQFRTQPISKIHFMHPKPEGSHGRARANQNVFAAVLRFRLGAEVAGHPGYYQLLREL